MNFMRRLLRRPACPESAEEGVERKALETFRAGIMPCCGKPISYYQGPRAGLGSNIRCAHCGVNWGIAPLHVKRLDSAVPRP